MKVRMEKINSEIQRALSEIISRDIKDPRVTGLVSVLSAETTSDLKHCKVYLSIYSKSEEEAKASFAAINKCAGFIRHELGMRVQLRIVPELHFVFDDSISYSFKISKMIDELKTDGDGTKNE